MNPENDASRRQTVAHTHTHAIPERHLSFDMEGRESSNGLRLGEFDPRDTCNESQ